MSGTRRGRRGAILAVVMLLLIVLFVMGMTLLSVKNTQAKSSMMMRFGKMAKYIALAGMENARVKLMKDLDFPPEDIIEDHCFTYAEELQFPDGSPSAGYYVVTVDATRNDPKEDSFDRTIRVTAVGVATERDGSIVASHRITAVLDASVTTRGSTALNPFRYQFVEWQEHGTL